MAEPVDLKVKIEDSQEIALGLIHDLSSNPVTSDELSCLKLTNDIISLLASGINKCQELIDAWPGEP